MASIKFTGVHKSFGTNKIIKDFNSQTKKYDAVNRCSSESYNCEKMSIEKLKHFISKDALNIDGLGKDGKATPVFRTGEWAL